MNQQNNSQAANPPTSAPKPAPAPAKPEQTENNQQKTIVQEIKTPEKQNTAKPSASPSQPEQTAEAPALAQSKQNKKILYLQMPRLKMLRPRILWL